MSSRSQVESREQPFQVVTQKRPSGQARKVFNRDKPPTARTQFQQHSEEPNSTVGNNRKRQSVGGQQTSRDIGKQSAAARAGNSVQMRTKDSELEREKEGEGGVVTRGHINRHSWDSAMQLQNSSRLAADQIEHSQSARFDRVTTTDTSNRFDRLNPDTEAPGEPKSGNTRARKRNSRSASGSSSYRSRSPKRKSGKDGKDQKGSQAPERGKDKESIGGSTTMSCELEWDSVSNSPKQQENRLVNAATDESELGETIVRPVEPLDQASIDKMSGASAQGGDSVQVPSGGTAPAGDLGDKDAGSEETKQLTTTRLSYSREELLSMRHLLLSQKRPESLKGKFFRGGKWCAEAWLATSTLTSDENEELEESESADGALGKNMPKLKNPTTLSIIREHDPKGYGKVCLSPQRRSFGSGCSWKDASSSGSASTTAKDSQAQSVTAANYRDTPFETNPDSRRSTGSRSGFHPSNNLPSHSHTNHTHPHAPHAPRVINHTPLRDQKGWKGEGGRGEKEKGKSYGSYRGREREEFQEEPEWMAFGPSDRSEVIELVGFDEHEKGRDNDRCEGDDTVVTDKVEEVGGGEEGRGAVSEGEGSPKTSEGSVGVEEGVVGVVRMVMGEEGRGDRGGISKEPENEFMLDGFDFSTGVSICQALASEEEEEEEEYGSSAQREGGGPLPPTVNDPHELSSALMKALRVGEEEEAYRHSGHPVNALTLEEVHERENIHTQQSPSRSDADQSAFNRLVAVLQSSGAIQDEPNTSQPPLPQKLPRPPVPLAMPYKLYDRNMMAGRVSGGRGMEGVGGGSFGYMLEKELRFDDDYSPSTRLSRMPAYHNSLGHTREPPLAKMDTSSLLRGTHTKSLFPTPHPHSHQAPPLSNRPSTLYEKWTERSWIHPETLSMEYGGLQRPPVDPLGPTMMHHHQSSGRSGSLAGRPPPNNWAVEMERRRLIELQKMRERERNMRERMMVGPGESVHHHASSKPNISLLPTAVMRQLHNSNPNHSLSDMAARTLQSSTADRLEQDMTSRPVSSSFGYPDGVGGHARADYPYPAAHMRIPPRPQHRGGMGLYTPPPQYIPIPHGMPSQQNPYLH